MSTFKGSLGSAIQENHQFFSDSDIMQNIGFASFTLNSSAQAYNKSAQNITQIYPSLPKTLSTNQTFLDIISGLRIFYTPFNINTKQFDSQERTLNLSRVKALIKYHEDRQFDSTTEIDDSLEKEILDINTSLEKTLILTGQLDGQPVKLKLFLQNRDRRSNERKLALKDNIMISATPVTPYGQHYSSNSKDKSQDPKSDIGALTPIQRVNNAVNIPYPVENSTFAQHAVAAPLQMSYDKSTNTWKSGNANCLARLLTDLDPAPILDLDDIEGFVSDTDATNWLNPESNNYVGGFSTGTAIPLSIEDSNPYLFGPDFVSKNNDKQTKIIPVVNRAPRAFAKGSIVMLTEINGEWIPQDWGTPDQKVTPVRVGDWSFIKLAANSDAYFKDDRFISLPSSTPEEERRIYANPVRNIEYEAQAKAKFYQKYNTNLARYYKDVYTQPELNALYELNKSNRVWSFIPSQNYLISTIFDQIRPSDGGFFIDESTTPLGEINVTSFNFNVDSRQSEIPFFWGPLFVDGYKEIKLIKVEDQDSTNTFYKKVDFNTFANVSSDRYFGGEIFLQNIPAEMTSKIIDPTFTMLNWMNLGEVEFTPFRAARTIKAPYYGSPTNQSKVQFSPLCLELIASDYEDKNASNQYIGVSRLWNEQFSLKQIAWNRLIEHSKQYLSNVDEDISDVSNLPSLLGNIMDRSKKAGYSKELIEGLGNRPHLLCRVLQLNPDKGSGGSKGFPESSQAELQNYTCSLNLGKFGSSFETHKGSNMVGIVAGKNTLTKTGGGDINFSVDQQFGSQFITRVTGGGQGGGLSILPIGGGVVLDSTNVGRVTEQGFPTWGNNPDNYFNFHTLALHARVFDRWPEEQTVFDPRYFAVLHFNPGLPYDKTGSTNVDIVIPTLENGRPIKLNETIDYTVKLKPRNEWVKNTIRRGMLLTGTGFFYLSHHLGLSASYGGTLGLSSENTPNSKIVKAGTNFVNDEEINLGKGAIGIVTVNDEGGITSFKFKAAEKNNFKYFLSGTGFVPADFSTPAEGESSDTQNRVYKISIRSKAGGELAIIEFKNGKLYARPEVDEPPKEYTQGGIRLTSPSQNGRAVSLNKKGFVITSLSTSVSVDKNNSGQYDTFVHFHNDVGVPSWQQSAWGRGIGDLNYIVLNIS
jgi:hypothetical protein